ncbi:hypothetical protein PF007_g27166 [Phytophthora fragariae]|uniref:Uncharacterized protein n=1 Tax=Phytophthora fragariae TaxID=53985 RepID=A0A6A3QVV0_9STRA|nr:hypothetical protein PF003_g3041 [Phytophthora fragariae]KAE8940386.1 hypothetical protein PF009_g9791 [Phytophthora fragariae]KAE9069826.1 hypothetical protein PF007_g27166 [Phytophthora fragariae]KAE9084399.1 hypothetical protein PF006_g26484 [Phytophthora fragariae]KAE9278062.1 hypothetical protein PF001_g25338 [Phytophthora fragariae]
MIVFGVGANNQVTNSKDANGTWLSINMCWGIGVLIGVYCSEGGSGANLKHARALRVRPPAVVKGPGYMRRSCWVPSSAPLSFTCSTRT